MRVLNFFVLLLIVSVNGCKTDSFDFDKLSSKTNLSPEIQVPVAQATFNISTLLDSLDLEVDDSRDSYATVYLKDTINDIGAVLVSDVFDLNDYTTSFSKNYALEPFSIPDVAVLSQTLSVSSITTTPDGTTIPFVPAASTTLNMGGIGLQNSDFSSFTFQSGNLVFDLNNNFPIPISIRIKLLDSSGTNLISSTPKLLGVSESGQVILDLSGVALDSTNEFVFEIANPDTPGPITIDYSAQQLEFEASISEIMLSKAVIATATALVFEFDQQTAFVGSGGEKLRQLVLEKATFELLVEHEFNTETELAVSSTEASVQNAPFERTYTVTSAATPQSFNWNLEDLELNFDNSSGNSSFTLNYRLALNLEPGSVVEANKNIQLSGSFKDLELAHAYGDFGVSTSDFTEEIELSEDLSDYFDKVTWFEPKIDLLMYSTVGIPASYTMDLKGYRKDGSSLDLEIDSSSSEPIINAPAQMFETAVTRTTYDNQNTNIEDFVSFLPDDKISAVLSFKTNPNGIPQVENFIHKDAKIWVNAEVEAPLHFNISDLSIQDTIRFEPPLKDEEDVDRIIHASLYLYITSDLPVDIVMESKLIDTLTQRVFTHFDPFEIQPASTNENGEVIQPAVFTTSQEFDSQQIDALKEGNGLAIDINVNTTDSQTKNAKISSSANIKLSAATKLKIQIDE
jgi:hypothetical protein